MSFMQPQVVFGWWLNFEDKEGGHSVDVDKPERHSLCYRHAKQYATGEVVAAAYVEKWGARLSAPGYMDCTEWCLFDTQKEAAQYLIDTYYDDRDDGEMTADELTERDHLTRLAKGA